MVITQNSSHIELISLTSSLTQAQTSTYLYANSSLFSFNNTSQPYMYHFYQWITGVSTTTASVVNYWNYAYLNWNIPTSSNPYELSLEFWTDSYVYMTALKINVLLFAKNIGNIEVANYNTYSNAGSSFSYYFNYNLNVSTSLFG